MVHILLCMIVKNEGKILERCIESVLPIIDGISICDTGSTDNTVEIIEKYVAKVGGKCYKHEWKNFGHNRTLSFNACVETAWEMGLPLEETYALHLDADMILRIKPEFKKEELKESGYKIPQINPSLYYYNLRLSRLSDDWKCVGVTHEYWSSSTSSVNYNNLEIDDRNDGGSKSDKYERDIRLLEQGLIDEPNSERYLYYLGQSYLCINKYNEAIDYFRKRIDRGGWIEEVFYSMLQIARCYKNMGNESEMVMWYLRAYEHHPKRAESLYELSNYYREKGKNQLSFMYARQASEIPFPKDDILFIDHNVYKYQCDLEKSIVGYYTPFYKQEGFKAINNLVLSRDAPENVRQLSINNIIHYLPVLSGMSKDIKIKTPEKYVECNPCLTMQGGQLVGCVRTVNFSQHKGSYKSRDEDGKIRTRNFFVEFDKNLLPVLQGEISDNLERPKHEGHVLGLEDMRIVPFKGEWWFTATTLSEYPEHRPQQCIGRLTKNHATATCEVVKYHHLKGDFNKHCEKNWLPFVHKNELLLIYHCEPFTIVKPDLNTGECKIISQKQHKSNLSNFRGSAPPIPYEDGYLFVIHEVSFVDWRTYYHRVVKFDKDFNITAISRPFIFDHRGVEFCISVVYLNNMLIFGVGIEDEKAKMYFIPDEKLASIF